MLNDWFLDKALEVWRLSQCYPVATILNSTVWLEEKHRQAPDWKTAMVIALHYLVLAVRRESRADPERAEEYCHRVVRWREETKCLLATVLE